MIAALALMVLAIAVPNYLSAQTRCKISRARATLRAVAPALESYKVDYNEYPYDGYYVSSPLYPPGEYNYWFLPKTLSTPTAYLTTCMVVDPFREHVVPSPTSWQANNVRYTNTRSTWSAKWGDVTGRSSDSPYLADATLEFGQWRISSAGPDKVYGPYGWYGVSNYPYASLTVPYDPTNGLISGGDIIYTRASANGYKNVQ